MPKSNNQPATPAKIEEAPGPRTADMLPNIQLQPFWKQDVQAWFISTEAHFRYANITSEDLRFLMVVRALPCEMVQEFSETIQNPPENRPYTEFKAMLIQKNTISDEARMKLLLAHEQLGDRLPSDMLRSMKRLLGNRTLDPALFKTMFLQRLPNEIRSILAPMETTSEAIQLAETADRVCQVQRPRDVHAIVPGQSRQQSAPHFVQDVRYANLPGQSRPQGAPRYGSEDVRHVRLPGSARPQRDDMMDMLHQLSRDVRMMKLQSHRVSSPAPSNIRGRSPAPPRSRTNRAFQLKPTDDPELCWFHNRHGAEATNCKPPCKWNQ